MKIITLPCICLNEESVFTDTAEKLFEDRFLFHFLKYIFGFTSFLYYENLVLSKDKSNTYSDFLNISQNFIYLLILFNRLHIRSSADHRRNSRAKQTNVAPQGTAGACLTRGSSEILSPFHTPAVKGVASLRLLSWTLWRIVFLVRKFWSSGSKGNLSRDLMGDPKGWSQGRRLYLRVRHHKGIQVPLSTNT